MQKVVGSNPISRFFANALHVGGSGSALEPETAISADSALHWSRRRGSGWAARYRCPMAQERITVDPNRMRGLPSIRDTRVIVSAVLGQLAAGASVDELLADYPYLEREDVLAALEYAAAAAQERELAVVAPAA